MSSPYRKLGQGEIRVLRLLPGSAQDRLSAYFHYVTFPNGFEKRTLNQNQDWDLDEKDDEYDRESIDEPVYECPMFEYEAISYAWGSPRKTKTIQFDQDCVVPITESLHQALVHFRLPSLYRDVWADALCINQDDSAEKSSQVAIMAWIYHASKAVLIWIGEDEAEDSPNGEAAMPIIEACNTLYQRRPEGYGNEHTTPQMISGWLAQNASSTGRIVDGKDTRVTDGFYAIYRLASKPWFHRLWVVQETSLSILRGETEIFLHGYQLHCKMAAFEDTVQCLLRNFDILDGMPGLTIAAHQHLERLVDGAMGGNEAGFRAAPYSMLRYSSRLCSDPRDRVYALLAICGLENEASLYPDYTLEAAMIYRAFVTGCLLVRGGDQSPFLLLAVVGTEHHALHSSGRVSWVPNLQACTEASRARTNMYALYDETRRLTASNTALRRSEIDLTDTDSVASFRNHTSQWALSYEAYITVEEPRHLRIRGRCFASAVRQPLDIECGSWTADDKPPGLLTRETFASFMEIYISIRHFFALHAPVHVDEVDDEMVKFLRYPTYWGLDRYGSEWEVNDEIPEEWFQEHKALCRLGVRWNRQWRQAVHWIMTRMDGCPVAANRRMWIIETECGRSDVAWLPSQALEGDQICIMVGAWWPFVVRPTGSGQYQLIGDCHVYGVPFEDALGGKYNRATSVIDCLRGEPLCLNMPDFDFRPLLETLGYITLC